MNKADSSVKGKQADIPEKFLKPYNSVETEARIYDMWEKSGYFDPDKLPDRHRKNAETKGADGVFSIVLPPPNVTGVLHMGSALMLAIEDVMVRYARMKGKKTLWVPGTDHAAIATQSVVEKDIQKKEGKSRHDLGREELLKRIESHVKQTHDIIIKQMRTMGCSIDWSREAFTLDEKRNFAVRTAFKKMYDDGLIYRGLRVINWDPKGQTTISDDEIEYETRKTKLYTFKYSKDIPISISTTRPETKLGDTAIAVHPDDSRYKKYIGKEFDAVFAGEPIHLKVIADQNVEKDFGTGALGVTPAHSQIDWEMGQKNGLPLKQVINEFARMTVGFDASSAPKPEFLVKDRKVAEAREAVVAWLKAEGLLEKEEDIEHNISLAQRTGGVVEPLPKLQWFVGVNKPFKRIGIEHGQAGGNVHLQPTIVNYSGSMEESVTLKELMKEAVRKAPPAGGGDLPDSNDIGNPAPIKIIPDRFERVYFNWIENLRDWCISRQIWYGHRIPVWYRKNPNLRMDANATNEEIYCGIDAPNGDGWKQDEDTLDTWFSSGLWTFSTLGWPEAWDEKSGKAKHDTDLATFHPTTILETGSDILFFWVARMILMSTYLLGEVPFKTVYLHGLVRDTKNRKISKSLGNNIDPLDMIAKYGADAVRMSLIVGVGPGNDSKIDEQKIKAYKLFANKLWNIARFVLTVAEEKDSKCPSNLISSATDKEHLARQTDLVAEVTKEMDEYKFYIVAEKLYQYVWHEFADKILEESKDIIGVFGKPGNGDAAAKASRIAFLNHALDTILKLLHPFMPYVTEEIWQEINGGKSILMVEEWPIK
jgi:valyl-tRNA synthetase